MLKTNYFTKSELEAYDRDGFILVKNFFDAEKLKHVIKMVDELIAMPDRVGFIWKFYEDLSSNGAGKILDRIENYTFLVDGWKGLIAEGELRDRSSELFGEDAILFKDKINFKYPGGRGFKPHQDMHGDWQIYAEKFLTASIALDRCTIENGCLYVSAGDHKRGLFGKMWEPIPDELLKKENIKWIPLEMEAGDVAFFDAYTPHYSERNLSKIRRAMIHLTYNNKTAGDFYQKHLDDKRVNYPPDIERKEGKSYVYRV